MARRKAERKVPSEAPVVAPSATPTRAGGAPPPEVLAAALAPVPGGDTAAIRFGVSLLVALAATLPAFLNVIEGRVSLAVAAARFLGAVAVAWAGAALVAKLFPRRPVPVGVDLPPAGPPADLVPGDALGAR